MGGEVYLKSLSAFKDHLWTNLEFISRPGETEVVTPQTSVNLNGCLSPGSKAGKPGSRLLPLHPSCVQQATTHGAAHPLSPRCSGSHRESAGLGNGIKIHL